MSNNFGRLEQLQNRLGGNLLAYVLAAGGMVLGLFFLFLALSLQDRQICNPGYAGNGQPNAQGQVVAGTIIERRSKIDGCQQMIIRIDGNQLDKFVPGEVAFKAAVNNPPADVSLTLNNLPARFDELKPGTRVEVLYSDNAPLAFSFPTGQATGNGLELGSDHRADFTRTRWIYVILAGVMLVMGATVMLIAWRFPVSNRSLVVGSSQPRRPLFHDPEDLPPE